VKVEPLSSVALNIFGKRKQKTKKKHFKYFVGLRLTFSAKLDGTHHHFALPNIVRYKNAGLFGTEYLAP